MIGYIYYIINKETGKRYIGQTLDVKVRKEKQYPLNNCPFKIAELSWKAKSEMIC